MNKIKKFRDPSLDAYTQVECIKSLYKSTYQKNAFVKGKTYEIVESDSNFYFIKDEEKNEMNFSKHNDNLMYYKFDDYFKII